MKDFLKRQTGAAFIVVILVIVLAVAGGGAAFLGIRMVVAGDGNFLQPFEDLGWIEPKEDDEDEDEEKTESKKSKAKDEDDDDDDKDEKKTTKNTDKKSANLAKYLVEEARLSSESKKSSVEHYYGEISMADELEDDGDEFADLYKLMKAGVNIYAQDGKAVEIAFGFDITDFCEEAYNQFGSAFESMGVTSAEGLQSMMMSMIESMFDESSEEYSEYVSKYVEGGTFQLYVTEKGFESLYDEYGIKEGENDIDTIIEALEDAFNTKISLVKD